MLSTSADSKFAMARLAPLTSVAMPSRAVAGLVTSREPSGPSKCTSPPNARVTDFPSPCQPGDSGEPWRAGADAGAELSCPADCAEELAPGASGDPNSCITIRTVTVTTATTSAAMAILSHRR